MTGKRNLESAGGETSIVWSRWGIEALIGIWSEVREGRAVKIPKEVARVITAVGLLGQIGGVPEEEDLLRRGLATSIKMMLDDPKLENVQQVKAKLDRGE